MAPQGDYQRIPYAAPANARATRPRHPHVRHLRSPDSVRYVLERVEVDVPVDDALFDPPEGGGFR